MIEFWLLRSFKPQAEYDLYDNNIIVYLSEEVLW